MPEADLISVIMPVYNSEGTLERALSSACSQQGVQLELICVDDGSTDRSLEILNAWQARDPRIKVLHQANNGVSSARNAALQCMQGTYFTLLDADDEFAPGYLAELLHCAQQTQADCVVGGWVRVLPKGEYPRPITQEVTMEKPDVETIAMLPPTSWGRLYLTAVQRRCEALFPLHVDYGEDTAFNYFLDCFCRTLVKHPTTGYRHYNTPTSASHRERGQKVQCMITALEFLVKRYMTLGLNPLYRRVLVCYAAHAMRRIRSVGPHSCQVKCARRTFKLLKRAGVTEEDLSVLRKKDAKSLHSILRGGSGLSFSYYWKRFYYTLRPRCWANRI